MDLLDVLASLHDDKPKQPQGVDLYIAIGQNCYERNKVTGDTMITGRIR